MHWANLTPELMATWAEGLVAAPQALNPNTPVAAAITIPSLRTEEVVRAGL
jgi:hypothetical protein